MVYFRCVLSVCMHGWRPKSLLPRYKLLSISCVCILVSSFPTSRCLYVIKGMSVLCSALLSLHKYFIIVCSLFLPPPLCTPSPPLLCVHSRNPWFSFEIMSFCMFYIHIEQHLHTHQKNIVLKHFCTMHILCTRIHCKSDRTENRPCKTYIAFSLIFYSVGQVYILNFQTWIILSACTTCTSTWWAKWA